MMNKFFLKSNFKEILLSHAPANIDLNSVDVWFQDETRVGQQTRTTRNWVPKGKRSYVIKQQQFICTYLFGAVCPKTGDAVGLIIPEVNTNAMQMHIDEIAKYIPKGRYAAIVLDRAAWHTTNQLDLPDNIFLVPLPAYSPELNGAEGVWKYIKDNWLSNKVFKTYEEIVDCVEKAWKLFIKNPQNVSSICSKSWCAM